MPTKNRLRRYFVDLPPDLDAVVQARAAADERTYAYVLRKLIAAGIASGAPTGPAHAEVRSG